MGEYQFEKMSEKMFSKKYFDKVVTPVLLEFSERPLHPDLEKCFECEERGNGVVKWNKALGWQLLKAHYEEHAKMKWLQEAKREGRLQKHMVTFEKFLPWVKESYMNSK